MKWALICFLAAAACGGGSSSNPCNGQSGLCLAVEVRGNNLPKLDVLNLTVTILPSRILTAQATILPSEITLPVQFAALLPADVLAASLQIQVTGIRAGVALASGAATATVPPSGQRVKIELFAPGTDGGGTVDLSIPPGGTDFAVPPGRDLSTTVVRDMTSTACVPTTCAQLNATCGTPSDGCGKTLSCGGACQLGTFAASGTLNPGLSAFASAQIGKFMYLFGGQDTSLAIVSTVMRAPINSDGTLGTFVNAGVTMTSARAASYATVVGGFVYLTGGVVSNATTFTSTTTVERAPINPDGTLGAFVNAGVAMTIVRDFHVAIAVKNFFYVIGGEDYNGAPTNSVERAPINADGTLGAFSTAGTALTTARNGATVLTTSSFVYVIAGSGAGSAVFRSIERATIQSDGTLGAFADAGIQLTTSRFGATAVAVGNDVYEIGGSTEPSDAGPTEDLTSIEHATLNGGGTLSAFTVDASSALITGRDGFGVAVTGNSLYVIGGFDGANPLTSIERAFLQ